MNIEEIEKEQVRRVEMTGESEGGKIEMTLGDIVPTLGRALVLVLALGRGIMIEVDILEIIPESGMTEIEIETGRGMLIDEREIGLDQGQGQDLGQDLWVVGMSIVEVMMIDPAKDDVTMSDLL